MGISVGAAYCVVIEDNKEIRTLGILGGVCHPNRAHSK